MDASHQVGEPIRAIGALLRVERDIEMVVPVPNREPGDGAAVSVVARQL